MAGYMHILWGSLGILCVYAIAIWGLSLLLKKTSIIDTFWAPGFVLVGLYYFANIESAGLKNILFAIMVLVWATRLCLHIGWRSLGQPEDARYAQWREEFGSNWWWMSFFRVFLFQVFLIWLISLPLLFGLMESAMHASWILYLVGCLFYLYGLYFESRADAELLAFHKKPNNAGKICDMGLWAKTRHPNYFGELMIWVGFYFFALASGHWLTLLSPALLLWIFVRWSIPITERHTAKSREGFEEYKRNTPALFPKSLI